MANTYAPGAFNVHTDLLRGVLAVTTSVVAVAVAFAVFIAVSAVVTTAAVLSVLHDVTAESFSIKFRLRCLSVKLFILFL